jgi:hypothetical protein
VLFNKNFLDLLAGRDENGNIRRRYANSQKTVNVNKAGEVVRRVKRVG